MLTITITIPITASVTVTVIVVVVIYLFGNFHPAGEKKRKSNEKRKHTKIILSWMRGWRTDSQSRRAEPQIKFKTLTAFTDRTEKKNRNYNN